jgi:hypothetical protein
MSTLRLGFNHKALQRRRHEYCGFAAFAQRRCKAQVNALTGVQGAMAPCFYP